MTRDTEQDDAPRATEEPQVPEGTEEPVEAEASAEETNESMPPSKRVAQLEHEVEELSLKWARAQADYKNLRRRAQADYELGLRRELQPLFDELLLVLDFLDMALASPIESPDAKNLVIGIEMTRAKMIQALENNDVRPIPIDGPFNPDLHEAASTVIRDDVEAGTIVGVVRSGYTWKDDVLRHAHVSVAARPESSKPVQTDEES